MGFVGVSLDFVFVEVFVFALASTVFVCLASALDVDATFIGCADTFSVIRESAIGDGFLDEISFRESATVELMVELVVEVTVEAALLAVDSIGLVAGDTFSVLGTAEDEAFVSTDDVTFGATVEVETCDVVADVILADGLTFGDVEVDTAGAAAIDAVAACVTGLFVVTKVVADAEELDTFDAVVEIADVFVANGEGGVVLIGVLFLRGVCLVRGETGAFVFGDVFVAVGDMACFCCAGGGKFDEFPLEAVDASDLLMFGNVAAGDAGTVTLLIETFGTVDEIAAVVGFAAVKLGTDFDCDVID